MSSTELYSLDYRLTATQLFELMRSFRWPQLLDSCDTGGENGRYDILVADPVLRLTWVEGELHCLDRDNEKRVYTGDAFGTLQTLLASFGLSDNETGLPFCGGAVGYLSYDLPVDGNGHVIAGDMPLLAMGIYDWGIVIDHARCQTTLFQVGASANRPSMETLTRLFSAIKPDMQGTKKGGLNARVSHQQVDHDFSGYQQAFDRIQHYLREGDCYQVNFARCFRAVFRDDLWPVYAYLREHNPVPFAAYLEFPFGRVLSASPERFLKVHGKQVEALPIKGTRPRSVDPAEDGKLYQALQNSLKDRAENLMIVDLLRNDLGKSCVPGSIKVPELFNIESYPTVFHLVSRITGHLTDDRSALDALKGCFPGGSITGAPKKRAMEIIAELESSHRGVYCGAIGYVGFDGNMDMNIAIRTLTQVNDQIVFWAGGGIVADSDVREEFDETRHKAAAFFSALGFQSC